MSQLTPMLEAAHARIRDLMRLHCETMDDCLSRLGHGEDGEFPIDLLLASMGILGSAAELEELEFREDAGVMALLGNPFRNFSVDCDAVNRLKGKRDPKMVETWLHIADATITRLCGPQNKGGAAVNIEDGLFPIIAHGSQFPPKGKLNEPRKVKRNPLEFKEFVVVPEEEDDLRPVDVTSKVARQLSLFPD